MSFVPQDVITAICHSRKWFPDIRKHECMLSSNKSMGARVPIPEVSQNGKSHAWTIKLVCASKIQEVYTIIQEVYTIKSIYP